MEQNQHIKIFADHQEHLNVVRGPFIKLRKLLFNPNSYIVKKICISSIFVLAAAFSIAQNPVKRTATIRVDEVPVAVRASFSRDFGAIEDNGHWAIHFIVEKIDEKAIAKPIWYSYNKRNKSEKAEVRYSPDGKLIYAKGFVRLST